MSSKALLISAHWAMAMTALLSLLIIYLAYGANLNLRIPTLVFLHIGLIVFPAFFKISYIVRLNALKQLGRPVN